MIGGGLAGLAAALTARQRGATVLVIEASPKDFRGGNTRHARNCRLAHSQESSFVRAHYPISEFATDLLSAANGRISQEMANILAAGSAEIPAWLSAHGALLQPWAGGQIPWSRKTAFFLGGGKTLLNALYAAARKAGIDVIYDSEVLSLHFGNSALHEVTVDHDSQIERIASRSIVACSGGYQANVGRLREYWGHAADNFIVRGSRYATGRILAQLWSAGAEPAGDPADCHLVPVDARSPQFDGGIVTRVDGLADGVVLDGFGRQLYSGLPADTPRQFSIWGRVIAASPGQCAYLVQNRDVLASRHASFFPPIDTASAAAATSLIPAGIRQSDIVRTGTGIVTPLRPGISFTGLGLKVDPLARPIWRSVGRAGIFAAGMIIAGNFFRGKYLSGLGTTIGIVLGRIAGREAAQYALS
ncbi:MAG: FAD-dependent tricarballylate dehydrogenase TcuA [Proteobacteria bacterium]|nr:FAD-dependent tricarballylate dehydrogenase TcuA [Pseudomonadota bacterium]